LNTYAE
jgi:hypothetical protein